MTDEREALERTFGFDACERLARAEQDYYSTHGQYVPPLARLLNATRYERDALHGYVEEIKKLASDPFASDTVALRACLLAANEVLGLPGPEPSPERDIAKAIIREARGG